MKKITKKIWLYIILILPFLLFFILWLIITLTDICRTNKNNITINIKTSHSNLLNVNDDYLFISEDNVCVYNGSSIKKIFPLSDKTSSVLLSSTSEYIIIVQNFLSTSVVTEIDIGTYKVILQIDLNNIIEDISAEDDTIYTIENSKLYTYHFDDEDYSAKCTEIENYCLLENTAASDFRLKNLSFQNTKDGIIIRLDYVNGEQNYYFIRKNDSMYRISDSIWISLHDNKISLFFQDGRYIVIDTVTQNIKENKLAGYSHYDWYIEDCVFLDNMFLLKIEVNHEKFGHTNNISKSNGSIICLFDSLTGECFWKKEFHRMEKCISVNDQYFITYYKNKYYIYSCNNRNVLKKYDADEIKNGGSYTFETCGDYIFVFDDNSGELLNTISIK